MDYTDAPTVRTIWDRTMTRRRGSIKCDCCKDYIEPGQVYQSIGQEVDGVFECMAFHVGGFRYPSGCPKLRECDMNELAAQAREDERLWNSPIAQPTHPKGETP